MRPERLFAGRSICVWSPVMTALRLRAEAGEEHEHLLGGGVLRLVEDDKGAVQRAPAHVGERSDLDDAALHVALHFLGLEHVVQRVVERAQIGHDLFLQVARQKAERLAGLDGGAGEDDARDLLLFQRGDGHGHGEVGLAGAGGADAEDHVVGLDGLEVGALAGGLRDDRRTLRARRGSCVSSSSSRLGFVRLGDGAERVEKLVLADGHAALPRAVELLEDAPRLLDAIRLALDAQPAVARGHADFERLLERLEQREIVPVERLQDAPAFELQGLRVAHQAATAGHARCRAAGSPV